MLLSLPSRLFACRHLTTITLILAGCGGGDGVHQDSPLERQIYLSPTPITSALRFDRAAQGYDLGCMLAPDGQAWCWGSNEDGQLGALSAKACQGGNVACSWQPVAAAPTLRWQAISPAQRHSCGIDTLGRTLCWGFGLGGQLGDGLSSNSSAPVLVAGGHRFVQVDAGRSSLLSCALDAAGSAWCWGPAGDGTLGNGSSVASNVPVQVTSSQTFVSVGAGQNHACAIDNSGQAWCWGHNPFGSLGRGVSGASLLPAAVTGGLQFAALAVGGDFNCGLTATGAAWCWGFGQALGDGVLANSDRPVAVAGGHVFASISAGYQHACGLTTDGSAWCWGVAILTGGGNEATSKLPVAVSGGQRWRALSAGGTASCGITTGGQALCFGINGNGAVGQNNLGP